MILGSAQYRRIIFGLHGLRVLHVVFIDFKKAISHINIQNNIRCLGRGVWALTLFFFVCITLPYYYICVTYIYSVYVYM